MKRTGNRVTFTLALAVLVALAPIHSLSRALAQVPSSEPAESIDIESRFEDARAFMQQLEYERAIAVLEPVLEASRFDADQLRETYLLLVEAHVYRGNQSAAGTKEQQLWYEEARDLIHDCLGVRELRHTQPDPPERYPAKMLQLFDDVRREVFGAFEIAVLEPADAEVTLDGELVAPDESGVLRQIDVPVGTHELVISHPDYREITADVEISPATVVTRSYALDRKRGLRWYATRLFVPVAAVAGVIVVVVSGGAQEDPDLAGPPPPPTLE